MSNNWQLENWSFKKMRIVKMVKIGMKHCIIGHGKFGVLKKYEDCNV